jgi:hypothetical protein
VTLRKFGGQATLALTRWDPDQPPSPYNLVLLMAHELDKMIGCKVKTKHRLVASTTTTTTTPNATYNNTTTATIITPNTTASTTSDDNVLESITTSTTCNITTGTETQIDPIMYQTNGETKIDARNGVRDHLSPEIIDRINKRLAWAKELYHRGDFINDEVKYTSNSSVKVAKQMINNTVISNINNNSFQINMDVTKGFVIGSVVSAFIVTTAFLILKHSRNS